MAERAEEQAEFEWLTRDGQRLSGSELELRAALSRGALAWDAMVWRPGWPEWKPAARVPELSTALPAPRTLSPERKSEPRSSRAPVQMPPLVAPRSALASVAPRSATRTAEAAAAPPSTRSRPSAPTVARPSERGALAPESDDGFDDEFDAVESAEVASVEDGPVTTDTLRPPGAVPPPPAGTPAPDAALASSVPLPASSEPNTSPSAQAPSEPSRAAVSALVEPDLASAPTTIMARPAPRAVPPPAPKRASALPSRPTPTPRSDTPLEFERDAERPPASEPGPKPASAASNHGVIVSLSALSAVLLCMVVALAWSRRPPRVAPEMMRSASSASPAKLLPAALGCRSLLPAARIAASVERRVLPAARPLANAHELALGFAASSSEGVGVRLNVDTLDVTAVLDEDGKDEVRRVSPDTTGDTVSFAIERAGAENGSAQVASKIGAIWPSADGDKLTEPRLAELPRLGYGVTFRRGGKEGKVLAGFVNADGTKHSALNEVPDTPSLVGTPVIAANADGALVAFAGREKAEAPWRIFFSWCKPGALPEAAREVVTGSGNGAISPALAALDGGRWALQWTEGRSEQYQVQVQSFDSAFGPLGARARVSPKGTNSGQGLLVSTARNVVSLFIVTTASRDELWGATLACP